MFSVIFWERRIIIDNVKHLLISLFYLVGFSNVRYLGLPIIGTNGEGAGSLELDEDLHSFSLSYDEIVLVIDSCVEEGGISANDGEVFTVFDWILAVGIAEADDDHA
jgi:hypothetical protein